MESLLLYIAKHASLAIAQRYVDAVFGTCAGLAQFPFRGVAREDIRPGLRLNQHKGRTVIAYAVGDDARMRLGRLRCFAAISAADDRN